MDLDTYRSRTDRFNDGDLLFARETTKTSIDDFLHQESEGFKKNARGVHQREFAYSLIIYGGILLVLFLCLYEYNTNFRNWPVAALTAAPLLWGFYRYSKSLRVTRKTIHLREDYLNRLATARPEKTLGLIAVSDQLEKEKQYNRQYYLSDNRIVTDPKDTLMMLRINHPSVFRKFVQENLPRSAKQASEDEQMALIEPLFEKFEDRFYKLFAIILSYPGSEEEVLTIEVPKSGTSKEGADYYARQLALLRNKYVPTGKFTAIGDGLYYTPIYIPRREAEKTLARLFSDELLPAILGIEADDDTTPAELEVGDRIVSEGNPASWQAGNLMAELESYTSTISLDDRFKHHYFLGRTGSGKTNILANFIEHDMRAGHGVVLITPEDDLAPERKNDLIYIDFSQEALSDPDRVVGINPLANAPKEGLPQYVSELRLTLMRALEDLSGTKISRLFNNALYALCALPDMTFEDIERLLDPKNKTLRNRVIADVTIDRRSRQFFSEYDKDKEYSRYFNNIIDRFEFLFRSPVFEILGTPSINLSDVINDNQSILVCNLSHIQGKEQEIVGQILLSSLQNTFFQRDAQAEEDRLPYFFYVDEFQILAKANEDAFREILTRARKYKVGLAMAHQNIGDISGRLSDSIFGNCGTLIGFNMSDSDAKRFARESQLKNFDDLTDVHGTRAHIRLRNLDPGQAAIMTPSERHATIVQTPERSKGFKNSDRVRANIAHCRDLYGQVGAVSVLDQVVVSSEQQSTTEIETTSKRAKNIADEDDDFFIEIQ